MPLISISIVALNLGQSAGTPLVIYNIRLTGLLMTRTKPQCGWPTAVAVVTWHLPGDWWCHTGCHHSLAQKGWGQAVYLCVGRHLVVVAAGSEKTRAGGSRGFLIYKDSPVWTPCVATPWMQTQTGLPRGAYTYGHIHKHTHMLHYNDVHASCTFHCPFILVEVYISICVHVCVCFNGWVWVIQCPSSLQVCPVDSLLPGWWNGARCHWALSRRGGECNQSDWVMWRLFIFPH